jgi:hypothetical protein
MFTWFGGKKRDQLPTSKGSISPPVAARWSTQMKRGDVFGNQGARVTQGPQIALLAMKTMRFQTIKHSRFKQHKNLQNNK